MIKSSEMCHRKAEQRASGLRLRKETTEGHTDKAVTEGKITAITNTGPIFLKSRGFCRHFEIYRDLLNMV